MNGELKEQINIVAERRVIAKRASEAKRVSLAEWESSNIVLITDDVSAKNILATEEANLRDMVVAIFKETGDKHPDPNVGIREVDRLIYDPALALNYAKDHGVALKLDTASFEKMAKIDELRPGFVTVEKIATATIATEIKLEGV